VLHTLGHDSSAVLLNSVHSMRLTRHIRTALYSHFHSLHPRMYPIQAAGLRLIPTHNQAETHCATGRQCRMVHDEPTGLVCVTPRSSCQHSSPRATRHSPAPSKQQPQWHVDQARLQATSCVTRYDGAVTQIGQPSLFSALLPCQPLLLCKLCVRGLDMEARLEKRWAVSRGRHPMQCTCPASL